MEAVWHDSGTDTRLKKRIVRTLIEEVLVDVDGAAGEIILVIHWKGGVHTELRLPRRRRGQNSSQAPKALIDAVIALARICSDDLIAGLLNRNGMLTGRGNRWTRERVTALCSRDHIPAYSSDKATVEGWMNLTKAAKFLGVSPEPSGSLWIAVKSSPNIPCLTVRGSSANAYWSLKLLSSSLNLWRDMWWISHLA